MNTQHGCTSFTRDTNKFCIWTYLLNFFFTYFIELQFFISCQYEYRRSHLGWHFRMLFRSSKLKARASLLPRFSKKRRSIGELWALSFDRAFENVTPRGIGCSSRKCVQHSATKLWWSWSKVLTKSVTLSKINERLRAWHGDGHLDVVRPVRDML